MNILYLCDEYPPGRHGGIGTAVQMLAREMVKLGHNVVVAGFYDWGYGGEDEFDDQGVKVYRFRRKLATSLFKAQSSFAVKAAYKLLTVSGIFEADIKTSLKAYAAFLEEIIARHRIDIAETPDYLDYVRFCRSFVPFPKLPVPTVVKLHGSFTYFAMEEGTEPPANIKRIDKATLHQADRVCSVSRYTASQTAKYLGYKHPIAVVYNGIDANMVTGPVPKEDKKVVFTGTLVKKKGIYQLMKAWNLVAEKMPGAELLVYGKGPVEKIKQLLSAKAASSVKFAGHVPRPELARSLAAAAVAVFPSYAECFALAPMEAMACKTAVIYSTRTSGPELITDGENGLLADPDNVDGLAQKIVGLLQQTGLRDKLAVNGQKHVIENFAIDVIARLNEAQYLDLLNTRKQ